MQVEHAVRDAGQRSAAAGSAVAVADQRRSDAPVDHAGLRGASAPQRDDCRFELAQAGQHERVARPRKSTGPATRRILGSARVAIPYGRQSIDEADVQAVLEVLRGDRLTQGPALVRFEQEFAAAVDAPYAVAFSSGTAGAARRRLRRRPRPGRRAADERDHVRRQRQLRAPTSAPRRASPTSSATPGTSARERCRAALTERTRAVVPVHFAGLPLPMAEIRAAVGADVTIIEDAAHAARRATPTTSRSARAGTRTWRSSPSTPSRASRPARAGW